MEPTETQGCQTAGLNRRSGLAGGAAVPHADTAGGTHVSTNSSAMSQCATVCRIFWGPPQCYWHGYGYGYGYGLEGVAGALVSVLARLHVTRLDEK